MGPVYTLFFTTTAATNITLPTSGTLATLAGSETLTNKTLTAPVIATISNTGTLTLPTATDTLVGRATTDTLTNKTINLASNTLSGTTAQFNTALSDNDFATLAGTETLTNKTLSTSSTWQGNAIGITYGGTGQATAAAAFNALSPMTTLGDVIYGGASGAGTRLAGNTTTTKKFLSQTGDGANSAAPVWATIAAADYPAMVGDSGTGGTQGAVPAPAAGDAAASKFLKADGTWTAISAANTALSNLASVAINTVLIPGTAGALDFGSTAKPWADIYLAGASGTPATNQFKLTGTSTSGVRTITLPDASGTVALTTSNVATATALQTARAINGVNFDGTAAITVPVNNADDTTTNTAMYPLWTATAGGNYAAKVSTTKLTFNPSTGVLTATGFSGPLTGNVTGNASGTAATVTGAAQTNITSVGTLTGLTMGGTLAMGTNSITMTGSLGATGARLTKGWFTDLEVTNAPTVGGVALYGVGNAFFAVSGPATSTKTFTFPNANATVLTSGAAEISAMTEKTTLVAADLVLIEDSAASNAKKKVQYKNILGIKAAQIQIVADVTDVETTSIGYIKIPSSLNGMNLIRAQGFVTTAGTTNATTIQVRNLTKYVSNDALSTAISIASGGTTGTAGTINTTYDDVSTDDNIKIYVTGVSTTKPKGLYVVLEFQLP